MGKPGRTRANAARKPGFPTIDRIGGPADSSRVTDVSKKPGDIAVLQVNPTVWAQALELADGDARRIEVRGELDVVVHNEPLPPGRRVTHSAPSD